jgi:predicted signal transduction protein with EAL and GGDEF domain
MIDVGVSISVALAELGETADDTFRRADAALYQAKLRGRGQSVKWDVEFDEE